MKTDDLITLLSKNVEAVDRHQVEREVGATIAVGAVLAVGAMLLGLGLRGDLLQTGPMISMLAKLGLAVVIVGLASIYLVRIARPGGEGSISFVWATLPLAATMVLAAISLSFAPASHWRAMIIGDEWLECLISIPIIAIAPFAAVIWVLRRMAPTDLRRTGALAGLVSGGLSAIGYSLHCMNDTLPFVALWYGGTIVLCTLAGAALGPRLLRW